MVADDMTESDKVPSDCLESGSVLSDRVSTKRDTDSQFRSLAEYRLPEDRTIAPRAHAFRSTGNPENEASVTASTKSVIAQEYQSISDPQSTEKVSASHVRLSWADTPGLGRTSTLSVQNGHVVSRQTRASATRPGHRIEKRGDSRIKKKVPQEMQLQWRVGAAPSVALALSKEESQMAKIVSQAIAYHNSMSDIFWRPRVHVNQHVFDVDGRVELFRDSSVAAASLVAAGRPNSAKEVLDKVLPSMDDLLLHPHPALYLILAELSLGLVKTPGSNLRDEIKRYLRQRATLLLSAEHPISQLLALCLPQARMEMLGERMWSVVIPILIRTFGIGHYQSSTMAYCAARNMASRGLVEQATSRIDELITHWSALYGSNSLIVCYAKIELANILIGTASHMKAEFVVSDALRTSDIIQAAELKNEDCNASEKRHREASIAFPRVGAFRTLGRIHTARGNYGAAIHYFSQAILIGTAALGTNSAAVELAQADLDKTREFEMRRSLETFSLTDLPKLANVLPSPIG